MPRRALDLEFEAAHAEAAKGRAERAHIGARVDQRGEQHVPGDAADAVEVQRARHGDGAAARAMRAAIVPAPKPSSMLTTATPAAHEHSIDSSALTPPKAAP